MLRRTRGFSVKVVATAAAALAVTGCASYDGRPVVEIELADAPRCLQQCSAAFQDCVPRVETERGLGLSPSAFPGDLTRMKHEGRHCRRENESCTLACNTTDADTIALRTQLRPAPVGGDQGGLD